MIKSAATRLQQQPRRVVDRQQQQSSGTNEFQPQIPQCDGQHVSPRRPNVGHDTSGERRNQHGY